MTLSQEQLLARAGDIDSDNLEAINLSTDENATIQHCGLDTSTAD
ncbi:hypothetical protein AB4422_23595 [Vibrio splendidus]